MKDGEGFEKEKVGDNQVELVQIEKDDSDVKNKEGEKEGEGVLNTTDGSFVSVGGESSHCYNEESEDNGSVIMGERDRDLDTDDDNDSVVEVAEQEGKISRLESQVDFDALKRRFGEKYAPLAILVNDRSAESTMNMHATTGYSMYLHFFMALSVVTGSTVLTFVVLGIVNEKKEAIIDSTESSNGLLLVLVIRFASSIWVSIVAIWYTWVVLHQMSKKQVKKLKESFQDETFVLTRVRRQAQIVVVAMVWPAWLIPPLNPITTSVDAYAYSLSRKGESLLVYFEYWNSQRYDTFACSLFVASMFYGIIYLFKWIRIQALKRERFLRYETEQSQGSQAFERDFREARSDFFQVRSTKGVVPRVALLYFIFRFVLGQIIRFDMGFVPCIDWISASRYCANNSCASYPLNAQITFTFLFGVWEFFMMVWICLEARRASGVLKMFFLLQGRSCLVSYVLLVRLLLIHFIPFFILGLILLVSVPEQILDVIGMEKSPLNDFGAPVAMLVASFLTFLCYFMAPCDTPRFGLKRYTKMRENVTTVSDFNTDAEKSGFSRIPYCVPLDKREYIYVKCYEDLTNAYDWINLEKLRVLSRLVGEDVAVAHYVQENLIQSKDLGVHDSNITTVSAEIIQQCIGRAGAYRNNFPIPKLVFSLDMAVLMWNFSITMNLTGNAKHPQSDPDVLLLVEDERFALVRQIREDIDGDLGLNCCIFVSQEMIIVTFRGDAVSEKELLMMDLVELHGDIIQYDYISAKRTTEGEERGRETTKAATYSAAKNGLRGHHAPRVWGEALTRFNRFAAHIQREVCLLQEQRARPVFLTGHGTGGTFASLCAYHLTSSKRPPPVAVYTYGSPRFCNAAFQHQYRDQVFCHFDVANVGDSMHDLHLYELQAPKFTLSLVRLGTLALFDSLGNLVIAPDWLEVDLMKKSLRKRFNAHETASYTISFMQWSQRLYGKVYRPLWEPALHDVKRTQSPITRMDNADEFGRLGRAFSVSSLHGYQEEQQIPEETKDSWRSGQVTAYLKDSSVGLGPNMEGACLLLKVKEITGLRAEKSMVVVSCGPPGISSALWEVGSTGVAQLKTSTIAQVMLLTNRDSSPRNFNGDDDDDHHELNDDEKRLKVGVQPYKLERITARVANFEDSEPILFGAYQKLRPCAHITLSAYDTALGLFGTASFPIKSLLPLGSEEGKSREIELKGLVQQQGDTSKLMVKIHVESTGAVPLDSMGGASWANGGGSGDVSNHRYEEESSQSKYHDADLITPYMALFRVTRNFDPRSQVMVVRVGLLKAALSTLDWKRGRAKAASSVVCEISVGEEIATTVGFEDVCAPLWNEVFSFGKTQALTGFEKIKIDIYGLWDDGAQVDTDDNDVNKLPDLGETGSVQSSSQSLRARPNPNASPVSASTFETGASNFTFNRHITSGRRMLATMDKQLVGNITMDLSTVIQKCLNEHLIEWQSFVPLFSEQSAAEMPGYVCLGFEIVTEEIQLQQGDVSTITTPITTNGGTPTSPQQAPTIPVTTPPPLDPRALQSSNSFRLHRSVSSRSNKSRRNMINRSTSGSSWTFRQLVNFSSSPSPGVANSSPGSSRSGGSQPLRQALVNGGTPPAPAATETPGPAWVISTKAPPEWIQYSVSTSDEREYIVKIYLQDAVILNCLETPWSGSETDMALDPFCEVSFLDPLNDFQVSQKKKTVTIRDSRTPCWEEQFVFGKERDHPIRGNEIVSVAVFHWEVGAPNVKIGEARFTLSEFRNRLNTKHSRAVPLLKYDDQGNPITPPSDDVETSFVSFKVMIEKFNNSRALQQEDSGQKQSPML